jgi:CRP/FNR family transcriptional regulator, cyclic AMP receptor protein
MDLRQGGFLSSLPPGEADSILAGARRRRFRRGDIVFHEGDTGETLHLVAEGRFGVQTSTKDGFSLIVSMNGSAKDLCALLSS